MESFVVLGLILLLGPYVVGFWAHVRAGKLEKATSASRRLIDDLESEATIRDGEIAALPVLDRKSVV